jgi:hypothetical protein
MDVPPIEDHFQARGIGESGAIRGRRIARVASMRDQSVEAQAAGLDQLLGRDQIRLTPFGGDANARLAHERGRKLERQRLAIEARERDLTFRRQARDQRVEEIRIPAHVVDPAIVASLIRIGMNHGVPGCAIRALRVSLPHRRRLAPRKHGKSREQTPENTVTDDEIRLGRIVRGERMIGGCRQRKEHGLLAQTPIDRRRARARHDHLGGRTSEESAYLAEASRTGNENGFADFRAARGPACVMRPTDSYPGTKG